MRADTTPGDRPCAQLARLAATFAGVLLAACTPPWYRFSTVRVEGRILPDGRCEAEVRGDVARRLALPTGARYMDGANLPEPLPPTKLIITCGALGPAAEGSRWMFFIAVPDPERGAPPGIYAVVGDDAPPAVRARPGVAAFMATLVPDPTHQFNWRDYRATGGTLTLTAVERLNPGGAARVEGHFAVRARRYVRFGG